MLQMLLFHSISQIILGILRGLPCDKQAPVYDKHSRQVTRIERVMHTFNFGFPEKCHYALYVIEFYRV